MSATTHSTSTVPTTQPATIAECCALYLPTAKRELVSYRARKYDLDDFCLHFGTIPVTAAKPYMLQQWLDRHPAWVSDWTRQRAAAGVQACFNWALRLGLIDKNPFKGFRVPGGERGQVMSDAEYRAILKNSPPVFRRLVVALRWTGARPGELIKATLENVVDGVIVLAKHKTVKKSKKPRRIILHPVLIRYVEWRRRQQWPTDLLFPNRCWRKWRNPTICYRLKRIRKLGLIGNDTTLYGLRHSFLTRMVASNVSLPIVAEIAGHGRVQTTMGYLHFDRETNLLQSAIKTAFAKPA